jgi:hypothetical protein
MRCSLRITSPYYTPRGGNDGITVVTMVHTPDGMVASKLPVDYAKLPNEERNTLENLIPRAEIPCLRWQKEPTLNKKPRYVLAMSRRYLAPRHGMATTDYDTIFLEERFHTQYPGADPSMFDLFKKRMAQSAMVRMRPAAIGISTVTKPSWIAMHANTDTIQNIVMAALQKTLRVACLNQWPGARSGTGGTQDHAYLVFTQPASVRVVEDIEADNAIGGPIVPSTPGPVTIIHFHTLMQVPPHTHNTPTHPHPIAINCQAGAGGIRCVANGQFAAAHVHVVAPDGRLGAR